MAIDESKFGYNQVICSSRAGNKILFKEKNMKRFSSFCGVFFMVLLACSSYVKAEDYVNKSFPPNELLIKNLREITKNSANSIGNNKANIIGKHKEGDKYTVFWNYTSEETYREGYSTCVQSTHRVCSSPLIKLDTDYWILYEDHILQK